MTDTLRTLLDSFLQEAEAAVAAAKRGEGELPPGFAGRARSVCAGLEALSLDERAAYGETAGRVVAALNAYIDVMTAACDETLELLNERATAAYVCGLYDAAGRGSGDL